MSRWKINEEARKVLEEQYLRKRFPSPTSKKRLAEELDVAPRRILHDVPCVSPQEPSLLHECPSRCSMTI